MQRLCKLIALIFAFIAGAAILAGAFTSAAHGQMTTGDRHLFATLQLLEPVGLDPGRVGAHRSGGAGIRVPSRRLGARAPAAGGRPRRWAG